MSKFHLLALLMGVLLVAAPFSRTNSAYASDDDDDDEEKDDVVVLTTDSFDSVVKKAKYALVEFYAPWCGHCKSLAPHWSKAATEMKKHDPSIVIAKVDTTVETELGKKFDVKGYPTLKWFVNGEVASDYNGPREADGIVGWIKKKTGPFATTLDAAEKLAEAEKANPVIMVAYFKSFDGAKFDAFKGVAEGIEDVPFFITTSADVAAAAGLDKVNTLAAIKNAVGEPREVVVMTEKLAADTIKEFVSTEKMPLTIEFNNGNSDKIFKSGISKQIIFWSKSGDFSAESENFKDLRAVAKAFKGKLVFVTCNNEGDAHEPITNYFGLKGMPSPVVLGFHMEKNKKYKYTEKITEEGLTAFAQSVLDGTAQADYKSAEIPAEPLEDGVSIVVGKSFDSIVMDPKKDVLLEVYAPWCGHCKKLTPIYAKLAKRFKTIDSVVIAKMDGTENEHANVDAQGYPTLIFYPADETKAPIKFEGGDRSLKALTKFIKQHAKVAYELPKKAKESEEKEEGKDEL